MSWFSQCGWIFAWTLVVSDVIAKESTEQGNVMPQNSWLAFDAAHGAAIAVALLLVGSLIYLRLQLSKTRRQLKKALAQPLPRGWTHDELTGLPNARLLQTRVQQRPLPGSAGAVVMFQIREFEQVNRLLGYQHGNLVLTQIAFRLNDLLEKYPQVLVLESHPQLARLAHVGGVEFACFVDLTEQTHLADVLVRDLLRAAPEPLMLHGGVIDYRVDAGIALMPQHSADVTQLLQQARMALHQSRWHQLAGNMEESCVYTPELTQFNQNRLAMMAQLQQAVVQQQLQLDVQPQIDLMTGELKAGEVLVRWQHPTQGLLLPKQFIPLAEELGILYPLTCWVLHQALDVLQQLHQAGEQIQIAVNVASKDLMQPEFVEYVVEQLTSRQLPPKLLVLECREDALLQDPPRALAMLNRFSELGITLSLDDFGTGYTSLGMLREMPIDQVKVDCQFISDIHRSDAQAAVTGAIIDMAKNMQWQVVAEGVEEQAAAETLARMGCQRGQGYYFSRPFALKGFLPWLRQYQHHHPANAPQTNAFGPQ